MNPNMTLAQLAALPMIERETILREIRDKNTRRVEKHSAEIVDLCDKGARHNPPRTERAEGEKRSTPKR